MDDPFFFKAGLALMFAAVVVGFSANPYKPNRARISWSCFALSLVALVFS